jgi:hypothetical protein
MVAQTRSSIVNKRHSAGASADAVTTTTSHSRRVKIMTPSFREASLRTYKVYTPGEHDGSDMSYIAEAIMELQGNETRKNDIITRHMCMNPMHPITQYAYSIRVYNSAKTLHYKSAYVLYDNTTRLYTVYSIISNVMTGDDSGSGSDDDDTVHIPPNPVRTVHTKYTTHLMDTAVNYITTLIVPVNIYDYYIQDDIIGIVASHQELTETAFGPDSSYYDISQLFQDDTSLRETIHGMKAFKMIPSREFWFVPSAACGGEFQPSYTVAILIGALQIVSQSQ